MMHKDKDWIKTTIAHSQPAAVPYNFSFCPPALAALQKHYQTQDVSSAIGKPIRTKMCNSIKPFYASPAECGRTIADEFGVLWTTSDIDRGSPTGHPLAAADLAGYEFPDPAEPHRFEGIEQWCRSNSNHFTIVWVGELWERATFMRSMENILLDVALNPAFVQKLLRGIADYILRTMEILFERFEFDAIALSDDYGTQKSMFMSPASWRELVRPPLAEIYALARKHGRYTFHHSCGNIVPVIPDLIDIGLDILHPIQPEAMDIHQLKRQFGKDITFCGGLRTHDLLPKGGEQEIRDEVRMLKETMGKGGGYILEPGITVQADVPLKNILAMIEEAKRGAF
ncbi:MAG: uroporphyrinogen decarboxylase family protein [Planctomycetota bacterium]|nr:uroporphyrinogen decarboxylase family protein [Planctomycetota bacterium]